MWHFRHRGFASAPVGVQAATASTPQQAAEVRTRCRKLDALIPSSIFLFRRTQAARGGAQRGTSLPTHHIVRIIDAALVP